jgi:hypothetical protein
MENIFLKRAKHLLPLLLIFILSLSLFYGCATPTKVVTYPPSPQGTTKISFNIWDFPKTKFVAENGVNSIKKDNVIVTIQDISESLGDDRFITTIEGPDGKNYKAGITPMMVVLNVRNDTDHIITLRQTIIKIEDNNLKDYQLISNIPAAKTDLQRRVERAFDEYFEKIDNFFKGLFLNNSTYRRDYEQFVAELRAESKKGDVRTQDMKEDMVLTPKGIEQIIEFRSPEGLYKENIQPYRDKIQPLKAKAIRKIQDDIESNISNVITSGEYPPISLIPGRMTKIVVPFHRRWAGEKILSLQVNIFDMPTEVDQASNPIKRSHFNFRLVAKE